MGILKRTATVIAAIMPVLASVACTSETEDEGDGANGAPAEGTSQDALVGGCGPDRLIANAPADKKQILIRAAKWLRDPVPYSMEDYKDGHRTDCSGYVSMAWGRSDFTTAQIPPRSTSSSIARQIDWDDLQVGDAVARGPTLISETGHVMLYAGTDYLGFSCFWEQTKPATRVSSVIKATLTGDYVAIRQR